MRRTMQNVNCIYKIEVTSVPVLLHILASLCNNLNSFNPFPHTTNLQQTTLNIFCQKIEKLYNWMDNLWLKVENIVAKGEMSSFVTMFLTRAVGGQRARLYNAYLLKHYFRILTLSTIKSYNTLYVKATE